MPSFSFTAPIITPSQEFTERRELDKKLCRDVECDIYGRDFHQYDRTSVPLDERLIQQALEGMTHKERKYLVEAMALAPEIVCTESPIEAFYSTTGYSVQVRILRKWIHVVVTMPFLFFS